MKIALFYHGQIRALDTSLLELLSADPNNQIDIYIHAWWDGTHTYKKTGLSTELIDIQLPNNTIDILIEKYKPKKILLEYPKEMDIPKNFTNFGLAQPSSITPHMYSIEASYKLCDNPYEYDWCIRSRFDLHYDHFNITTLDTLNKDYVYVANIHNYYTDNISKLPHDIMLMASGKNADIVLGNIYTRITEYGISGIGEHVLYHALQKNNIQYNSLNIQYHLERNIFRV